MPGASDRRHRHGVGRGSQATAQGRLYKNHQGFTVRYYPFPGTTTYPGVATGANSITLSFPFKPGYGGTSYLTVIGQPDGGATPQQIVDDAVGQMAPNAQLQFLMPQAYVGYWPGYGEAFVTQVPSADGKSATYELMVLAAVHDGFGIAVVASGQLLDRVTPSSSWWDGHPSPAAINVAYVGDNVVNSIEFRVRHQPDGAACRQDRQALQAVPAPIASGRRRRTTAGQPHLLPLTRGRVACDLAFL